MRIPLTHLGSMHMDRITREDLARVLDCMAQLPIKAVTVRKRMGVLKTVFRWCSENGFCSMPDFPKVPAGLYEKFVPSTTAELAAILEVASNHIVRCVVLGAQLGVRVGQSELMQLTWDDVDLERGILRVHGSKKNLNSPWREVPIRQSLLPVFAAWNHQDAGSGYLIYYQGKPVKSIKTAWRLTLKRAGITRRIRPYDLRHAFGTDMVAAGIDVGTVAKLMGHSTPAMLLNHYQYVMDTQKKAAVECLPDLTHVPNGMCPNKSSLLRMQ